MKRTFCSQFSIAIRHIDNIVENKTPPTGIWTLVFFLVVIDVICDFRFKTRWNLIINPIVYTIGYLDDASSCDR